MATQLKQRPATGKQDAFIASQLAKAQGRVRWLDVGTALLTLLGGCLLFVVVMVLLDARFVLSAASRQGALVLFALAAVGYLVWAVLLPLRYRVNPHYAARRLEETLPGSRNHVINWVDLHDKDVPPALHAALTGRAAKDVGKADVDEAFSYRPTYIAGGIVGALVAAIIALFFLLGPAPFASLLGRAFAPFGRPGAIATRTQIQLIRPEGGDLTLTRGVPLTVLVEVTGRVPDVRAKDAPHILFRHNQTERYRKRPLQPDDTQREWGVKFLPDEVGEGMYYKVTAGDAETPEYRVSTRPMPLISDFVATYRFRPYVGRADRSQTSRALKELRGTTVEMRVETNRHLREGRMEIEGVDGKGGDILKAELRKDDPRAMHFRLVLDRPGHYLLRFTSTEGESYVDPMRAAITVLPDEAPRVALTKPAKDESLPPTGHLELEGEARDDIGIAALALHLRLNNGENLQPRPYLADKLGQPGIGTPRELTYRELLELSSLRDARGQPVTLKAGDVIEYWLEARDGCDFPKPNEAAKSKSYKITIVEPPPMRDEKKEQQERDAARERQEKQKKEEEDRLKKEQAKRDEEKRKEEEREREEERQREQQRQQRENQPQEKKDGEKSKDKGPRDQKPGEGGQGNDKERDKKDDATEKKAQDLKDALERKEKERQNQGEKKPEGNDRGEAKDNNPKAGEGKPGADKKEGKPENQPGQKKPQDGKQENQGGEQKGGDNKPEDQGKQGAARPENARPDAGQKQGEAKEGAQPDQGNKPGEPKAGEGKAGADNKEGKPEQKPGQKKPEAGKQGGEQKGGDNKPEDQGKQGAARPENARPDAGQKQGEAKEGAQPDQGNKPGEPKAGEGKQGGNARPNQAGEKKPGENKAGDGEAKPGERKPGDQAKQGQARQGDQAGKPAGDVPPGQGKDAAQPKPEKAGEGKPAGQPDQKAGEGKGPAKPENGQPRAGQPKGQGEKPPEGGQPKDGGEKGQAGKKAPEQARPEDVRERARDLQNRDAGKRAEAKKDLNDIKDKANDPKAREEAKKALEDAQRGQPGQPKGDGQPREQGGEPKGGEGKGGEPRGGEQGGAQPKDKGQDGAGGEGKQGGAQGQGQKPGEAKQPGGKDGMGPQPGAKKDGAPGAQPPAGEQKGGEGKQGDQGKQGAAQDGKGREGGQQGEGKPGAQPGQQGDKPGEGKPGGQGPGNGGGERDPMAPERERPDKPVKPDKPGRARASEIQLEEFRKKITSDILKDAKMSKEEYEKFLRDYAELARRQKPQPGADDKDVPPRPGQVPGALPSLGGRAIKPGTKQGDLKNDGRGKPPPEYRETYREFKRLLEQSK